MTAEDTDHRDDESAGTEDGDRESTDREGDDHEAGSSEDGDRADDSHDSGNDRTDESDDDSDDSSDDNSDDDVKEHDRYDDDTTGVADARPGRADIGEAQMPSDYHEAVAQRPVEVNLPETPDLSEDEDASDEGAGDRS